jgi:hypothetical protein
MILMLASTPVAGVVDRLARWVEPATGKKGHAIVQRNYANNAFRLSCGAVNAVPGWREYVADTLKQASLCVVHNVYDRKFLDLIFAEKDPSVPIVFQVHSPPLEPPAFSYSPIFEYEFDKILTVAQGYQRFVPGSVGVPNVVPDTHYPSSIRREKTLFVPHMRSTGYRWSSKFTKGDADRLRGFVKSIPDWKLSTVNDVFNRDSATHEEILFYLRSVSMLVDDVNTGLFHQTTIEGLKAHAVVFSGVDYVSQEEHCIAADAEPLPVISVSGVEDVIDHLSDFTFTKKIEEHRKDVKRYAERFLDEERLALLYFESLREFIV